jgi:sugar phosphate isomerase/epimerase
VRRIFASTGCVRGEFWDKLDRYRDAGLEDVELGTTTEPLGDGLVDRLREHARRYVVHNYFPPPAESFVLNLASPDDDVRARSLRLVEHALETAAALGSPLYSVHAGFVSDPTGFDGRSFVFAPGGDAEAAKDRFREAIGAALDRARDLGVELLVENNVCTPETRGALLLQAPDEFEELTGFGILLDTGHLNVSATTLGFDRSEFVRRLGPRIRAFHLHDNDGSADRHEPAAAGSWAREAVRATDAETIVVEALFANVEALRDHVEELRRDL